MVSAGSPLLDQHALDLGGTYGVPEVGDPIQYDELRIEHDRGDVEIVVYNRAILLFFTDSETVRRIHEGVAAWRTSLGDASVAFCPWSLRGSSPCSA